MAWCRFGLPHAVGGEYSFSGEVTIDANLVGSELVFVELMNYEGYAENGYGERFPQHVTYDRQTFLEEVTACNDPNLKLGRLIVYRDQSTLTPDPLRPPILQFDGHILTICDPRFLRWLSEGYLKSRQSDEFMFHFYVLVRWEEENGKIHKILELHSRLGISSTYSHTKPFEAL